MKKRTTKKDENLIGEYVVALASLLIFIYIIFDLKYGLFLGHFDLFVNSMFNSAIGVKAIFASIIVTDIFRPISFILLSFIAILYLFYKGRNREATIFLVVTSASFIIGTLIKVIIERARPENILVIEKTFSFPSTHALMAVIFFGLIIYLLELHVKSTKVKTLFTVMATLAVLTMGLTRIVLNAHYFTDVIAGFSLGVFLICVFLIVNKKKNILPLN